MAQEFLHLPRRHSGPAGDSLDPGGLHNPGICHLRVRHGVHDDLESPQSRLRTFHILVLHFARHPRNQGCEPFHGPHVREHVNLIVHLVERELAREDLLRQLLRLLGINGLLCFLEEGGEIPHAKQARDESRGLKFLEIVELLAHSDEENWRLHLGDRTQGAAALRGAVQLRDNDTCDGHRVVEGFCLGTRLLANGRVDDEKTLVRGESLRDPLDLPDEIRLQGVAPRRVHDHDIHRGQRLEPGLHDARRILRLRIPIERGVDAVRDLTELIVGGRPMDVRGDEAHGEPLLLEVLAQFPRSRRLALAVQSDKQEALLMERHFPGGTEDFHEFLIDDSYHVLPRTHPGRRRFLKGPPLEFARDRQGEGDLHIGLKEGSLNVPNDLFDEGLVDVARARDFAQSFPQRTSELLENHLIPPRGYLSLTFAADA